MNRKYEEKDNPLSGSEITNFARDWNFFFVGGGGVLHYEKIKLFIFLIIMFIIYFIHYLIVIYHI